MKLVSIGRRNDSLRLLWLQCLSVALLLAGFPGSVLQAIAAEPVTGVTYGQPRVMPGEFNGDLSKLPALPATRGEAPIYRPLLRPPPSTKAAPPTPAAPAVVGGPLAPMPSPIQNFAGMSKTDLCTGGSCGSGWPPDPNGIVGPNHYLQLVNSAVAIYNKTGTLLARFTEDNLWSGTGINACNGNSQGDPIALYDWLTDRFVITWFAFATSGGNPVSPYYECIAASKTSDPVAGGWWLYPVRMDPGGAGLPPVGDLNDYPKFGLWHDCLYMAANEFTFPGGNFDGVSFASFSRSDLYSGAALTYSLGFLAYPANQIFTMVPSNNNGKGANAVPPGTPNYFVSESFTGFAFEVRTFTAGTNCGAGGTLSGPTSVSQTSYGSVNYGNVVPQPNTANTLDNIDDRIMQKVQYRKIGGTESLWVTHNVDTGATPTAMQWAQINVTGGTIVTTPVQQQIYAPDTTLYRWMGSIAADRQGNVALGYSTSNATSPNFPSLAYSGRLAGDPLNTLPQTEVQLIAGAGSQVNNCGGAACHRWGDYSSMAIDPADDCTFWYTNEYYSSQSNGNGGNWQTRIGSFGFPSCTGLPSTTTTVASSLNPSTARASVTFTATVTGTAPTGSVDFTDGGTSIGGCAAPALTGGGNTRTATCIANSLLAGTHSIVASYSGDGSNAASSSSPLSQVVQTVSSTALASSLNPSTAGASVVFTATVSGTNPTGTVNFADGGISIGGCATQTVGGAGNVRTATCSTSSLAAGMHGIVASYSGDAGNTASSSAPLSQIVGLVDQTFTPITPCRVVDTRNLGGPIGAFATRNFFFFTTSGATNWFTLQGGVYGAASTLCPATVITGYSPSAAVANVTVTGQGGSGNLILWQGTSPVASADTLSYPAAGDTSTLVAIPWGGRTGTGPGGAVEDFGVFVNAFTPTNVVVDIVGYYTQPAATALDCTSVNVAGTGTVANGSTFSLSPPACPTGYTRTGAGCYQDVAVAGVNLLEISPAFANACYWANQTGSSQSGSNFHAEGVCCRVPGH